MSKINLEQAGVIVDETLRKGRELGLAPLTVAVLDDGGHLTALKREDLSGIMRVEIASAKAWGALGMGFPSRVLSKRAEGMPLFFDALTTVSGGRLVALPGGVLIRDGSGGLLGAVGVSGDVADNDEICAVHGVEAAGLIPDIG